MIEKPFMIKWCKRKGGRFIENKLGSILGHSPV